MATAIEVWESLDRIEETLDKCMAIARLQTVEFASTEEAEAFYAKYYPSSRLEWGTRRYNRISGRFQVVARDVSGPLRLITCMVYVD